MKRLLDTLIAHWKLIVSIGDYAFSLDRKKETPRPRLPQALGTTHKRVTRLWLCSWSAYRRFLFSASFSTAASKSSISAFGSFFMAIKISATELSSGSVFMTRHPPHY